jgi:hypothetical protein
MLSKLCLTSCLLPLTSFSVFSSYNSRKWQFGTLLETEKQQVLQGSTQTSHSERTGDGTDRSRDSTFSFLHSLGSEPDSDRSPVTVEWLGRVVE